MGRKTTEKNFPPLPSSLALSRLLAPSRGRNGICDVLRRPIQHPLRWSVTYRMQQALNPSTFPSGFSPVTCPIIVMVAISSGSRTPFLTMRRMSQSTRRDGLYLSSCSPEAMGVPFARYSMCVHAPVSSAESRISTLWRRLSALDANEAPSSFATFSSIHEPPSHPKPNDVSSISSFPLPSLSRPTHIRKALFE